MQHFENLACLLSLVEGREGSAHLGITERAKFQTLSYLYLGHQLLPNAVWTSYVLPELPNTVG